MSRRRWIERDGGDQQPGAVAIETAPTPAICVDVRRAAAMLGGISPFVVRGWIASGLLPAVRFPSTRRPGEPSRRVLVFVGDLEDFVRKHREETRG